MRRLLWSLVLCACACGPGGKGGASTDLGDFDRIHQRGVLRVLLPDRVVVDQLPRGRYTLDNERQLIEQFAHDEGLRTKWVRVAARQDLLPKLLAGHGDLVAANLTASKERRGLVDFSVPTSVVREQLVARRNDPHPVMSIEDLEGRTIHIRQSSSFWSTVRELQARRPGVIVELVPEDLETEEILHRVAEGVYDLTVADSNLVEACREYDLNVESRMDLTGDRALGFAVRPDSEQLLDKINRFLTSVQLRAPSAARHTDDLDGIGKRRVLRVLTRNHASTYFVWRGQLRGFEYELAGEFAREHGLRLEMVVPRPGESLYDLLREGRGDVIAAALTPTPDRRLDGVVFCKPYNHVSHVVVARDDETAPLRVADLRGRTFSVRRSDPFWRALSPLREEWGFELEAVPESTDILEVLDRVATGEYDLTLADSLSLALESSWRDDLRGTLTLREKIPLSWAVRESNPKLAEAVDTFVRDHDRSLFYNVIYERYFGEGSTHRHAAEGRASGGRLSPYDEIVQRLAFEYGFDWRMIVAQMYQESGFDQDAHSFAGAQGLMQMMPQTAMEFGIGDLGDPENAIHAGIRYLDWVRDRFEPELSVKDRMWFTLAAYNAGPGHVTDARRLAGEIGLNPNRWFENVEKAMLLLSQREYSGRARHGYCRCGEPVAYVREIRQRYNAYVESSGS